MNSNKLSKNSQNAPGGNGEYSQGFTLIEVILYVGIVLGMLGSTIVIVNNILVAHEQNAENVEVYENASFAMRKIAWVMDDVNTINIPGENATSTTLSVDKASSTENSFVVDLSSSTVRLSTGGGSYIPLTNSRVVVDTLEFNHVSPSSSPDFVRVTLSLSNIPKIGLSSEPYSASTTIETTFFLTQ